MKPKKKERGEAALKYAAEIGINLQVTLKPSGKILFPEKHAKANEILSKMEWSNTKDK